LVKAKEGGAKKGEGGQRKVEQKKPPAVGKNSAKNPEKNTPCTGRRTKEKNWGKKKKTRERKKKREKTTKDESRTETLEMGKGGT